MKVEFEKSAGSIKFDHEDIMGEIPFDIGPFIDTGDENALYVPVDDSGNGPFWVKIEASLWEAFSTENLPVRGPLLSVDPVFRITL